MIDVLIADDQALVRAGLTVILGAAEDIRVVGEAPDGDRAVALARELRPDVVCMDIRMPGLDGISATRRITADPDITARVLVVTTFDVDDYVFGALEAGAAGFLLKGADEETLLGAIRSVAAGEGTLDQKLTRRVLAEFSARRPAPPREPARLPAPLTARELDILALLSRGMSNQEIASELFIETTTVKYHLAGILTKTGARDRLQAVVWAFQHGVVEPPVPE
jgi:DNA-binding NarL/FixJ family response regulator